MTGTRRSRKPASPKVEGPTAPPPVTLRRRLHEQLDPEAFPNGLSWVNLAVIVLILASVAFAVLETEAPIRAAWPALFATAEVVFATLFTIEYLARAWVCVESERYGPGWGAGCAICCPRRRSSTWPPSCRPC